VSNATDPVGFFSRPEFGVTLEHLHFTGPKGNPVRSDARRRERDLSSRAQ
jgi:hypothetical protein